MTETSKLLKEFMAERGATVEDLKAHYSGCAAARAGEDFDAIVEGRAYAETVRIANAAEKVLRLSEEEFTRLARALMHDTKVAEGIVD